MAHGLRNLMVRYRVLNRLPGVMSTRSIWYCPLFSLNLEMVTSNDVLDGTPWREIPNKVCRKAYVESPISIPTACLYI